MSRPITLPEPWRALALALGGVRGLAAECSVDVKTIWRWANAESTPGEVMRRHVDGLARGARVKRPWGGA